MALNHKLGVPQTSPPVNINWWTLLLHEFIEENVRYEALEMHQYYWNPKGRQDQFYSCIQC